MIIVILDALGYSGNVTLRSVQDPCQLCVCAVGSWYVTWALTSEAQEVHDIILLFYSVKLPLKVCLYAENKKFIQIHIFDPKTPW